MSIRCLIATTTGGDDGLAARASRVLDHGGPPAVMLPLLIHIWRHTFATDTAAMAATLAGHDWAWLNADPRELPQPGLRQVPGVGYAHSDAATPEPASIPAAGRRQPPGWVYVIDAAGDAVTVYTVPADGLRRRHSRHRLGLPAAPPCGDAATGHTWTDATVVVEDWIGPYPAQVCTGTHPHPYAIARFTTAVAERIAADTQAARGPGPHDDDPWLRRGEHGFDVVRFAGTEYEQVHPVARDRDGRHLVGAHLWDWRVADPTGPRPAPGPTAQGWVAVRVRHGERVYHGHIRPGERWNGWLVPGFTFDVAARVAADSYADWCAHPDPTGGEFYRLTPDGVEFVYRPATPDERVVVEETEDGLYLLGGASWTWESAPPAATG